LAQLAHNRRTFLSVGYSPVSVVAMTWKIRRDVLEKKTRERSNSVLEARAVFLSTILHLHPEVVTDLWKKSLFEFALVVAHTFRIELLREQVDDTDSGTKVLARLRAEAVNEVEASGDSNLKDERVDCLTFAAFGRIDSDRLQSAFPDWHSLKNSKDARSVSTGIHEWSVQWKLDADWCRDHAVSVLREWVTDAAFKWAFLSPGMNSPVEQNGWQRATSARIWAVQWSRVGDALTILGDNLKPFKFGWQSASFDAPGWNYLKDKETDWRSRTRLRFSIWLSEKELERMEPFKDEIALGELTAAEIDREVGWRAGALSRFDTALETYLQRMRLARKAAMSTHDLIDLDEKRKLQEYINWAVKYQVGAEGLLAIASSVRVGRGGVQPSTVSRGVEEVLTLIGLLKRHDAKPGRVRGHKNRTPRILRDLGR
jgi:hypothetical protein